jgi:hypothetical protein
MLSIGDSFIFTLSELELLASTAAALTWCLGLFKCWITKSVCYSKSMGGTLEGLTWSNWIAELTLRSHFSHRNDILADVCWFCDACTLCLISFESPSDSLASSDDESLLILEFSVHEVDVETDDDDGDDDGAASSFAESGVSFFLDPSVRRETVFGRVCF